MIGLLGYKTPAEMHDAITEEKARAREPIVVASSDECPFSRVQHLHDCAVCRERDGLFSYWSLKPAIQRHYDTRACMGGQGKAIAESRKAELRDAILSAGLTAEQGKHTFAAAVYDANNRDAYMTAKSWKPGPRGLLITAKRDGDNPTGNGVGKSYLMHAMVVRLEIEEHLCRYWNTTDLLREMKDSADDLFVKAAYAPILLLDNMGGETISRNGWEADKLFSIIDRRTETGRPLILATRFSLTELADHYGAQFGPDIVSRIRGNCEPLVLGGRDRR
jgi:DNA replication protein DnaC